MFLDITILLIAAVIAVPLSRLLRLGNIPGFLIAGIIVGPSGLGIIDNVAEISRLSELGVVLLLFAIGIELKPARLWLMRRQVFGLGLLQVFLTGLAIAGVAYWLLDVSFRTAVVVGPALALSSTAFVLQLLSEQKTLQTEYGRAALSVLLLQDLAVIPLLALVPLLTMPQLAVGADIVLALAEAVILLVLVIAGGRFFLHPVLYRIAELGSQEVFTALTVALVLGSALVTEHIGMSMALGAFIAGLLIADSPFRHQVMAEIQPFRGLLLGLFFISMGMLLDIGAFLDRPGVILVALAVLTVLKVIILWPLTVLFGLAGKSGAAVALLLAQSGEFGLILFAVTRQAELISEVLFQTLLLVVVLSMLATPLLALLAHRLQVAQPPPAETADGPDMPAPIILAGFGRVGQRIGDILTMAGRTFVAVDKNATLVDGERKKGYEVFYGDARLPQVLRAIGAAGARFAIVTVDDRQATEALVTALRNLNPDICVLARAHDADQCAKLYSLGANLAVSENFEASLELARAALIRDAIEIDRADSLLRRARESYYTNVGREKGKNA